jgi:hypothetical protein
MKPLGIYSIMWIIWLTLGCRYAYQEDTSSSSVRQATCSWEVSQKQYERDSMFIVLTAEGWIKSRATFYEYWSEAIKDRSIRIAVDTIYYDSTRSKLFSILSIGYYRKDVEIISNDYPQCNRLYDSRAMIGYLDSLRGFWKLFDPDIYAGIAWCDSTKLMEETYRVFLEELPARKIGKTVKNSSGKVVSLVEDLKYNPVHCDFWTASPLWKLGYRIPGYYSFEGYDNAGPLYPNSIKDNIIIKYPDSLTIKFR